MIPMAERTKLAGALEVVARVEEIWKNARLDDDDRRRYAHDICQVDPAEALTAVEVLARSGREFAPTAPMVLLEVARLQVDAPDWGDVKRQLVARRVAMQAAVGERREWTCPDGRCDGSGFVFSDSASPHKRSNAPCSCRPAMIADRRRESGLHPLVREFVTAGYATWGEVDTIAAGEATTLEAQMRMKWEQFSQRAVLSRAIAHVEGPASLRRLDTARQEDAGRKPPRRGLERPDYLAALPERVAS
jgi:hypothetical protein